MFTRLELTYAIQHILFYMLFTDPVFESEYFGEC